MSPLSAPPTPANTPPIPSTFVNGGFEWREEEALRRYLDRQIAVWDQTAPAGGRKVPAYFRDPENEQITRNYPYLLIDNLGWVIEHEREIRGPYYLAADDPYTPDGTDPTSGLNYLASEIPIPVLIHFQVQAWARRRAHVMWIERQITTTKFPPRFGALVMGTGTGGAGGVPPTRDDNTVRRIELLDGPVRTDAPDPENAGKRVFGTTWTVGISSELLPADLQGALRVSDVVLDPSNRAGFSSVAE